MAKLVYGEAGKRLFGKAAAARLAKIAATTTPEALLALGGATTGAAGGAGIPLGMESGPMIGDATGFPIKGAPQIGAGGPGFLKTLKAGDLKGLMKSGWGQVIFLVLAQMLLNRSLQRHGERTEMGMQTEMLQKMTGQISPEDVYYRMRLGDVQAEQQMAQQALMESLSGVSGPSLARGEERT